MHSANQDHLCLYRQVNHTHIKRVADAHSATVHMVYKYIPVHALTLSYTIDKRPMLIKSTLVHVHKTCA